ncbi:beta-1,3-galactosyltransferase 2-like [Spea bombifrons]|uniref:beta-1,3-galactosyltransferase 2-like n=1 Tax=Spea bombifrons TaxID=233779 RepID=UPI002349D79F|nr:beta-1,3-galactosyltransferase 2-like [Spea bombifrons]
MTRWINSSMFLWKRHHCCPPWLKWHTRSLVSKCFATGFLSLFLLLFMLSMLNNFSWFPRKIVRDNIQLHNLRYFSSRKSHANNSAKEVILNHWQFQNGTKHLSERGTGFQDMVARPQEIHHYGYIINEPTKCQEHSPFLILLVAAIPWQLDSRQSVRQTWGQENIIPGVRILRLFLLGRNAIQKRDNEQAIVDESQQYHDIIQQEYLDTYNNLTTKTLMGMKWVATYCPHAQYVMKTDSDMFVNTEYLVKVLLKPDLPPRTNYFTGYIMKGYAPNRNKHSKWYMPPDLYPGDLYPVFCSGTGYVFSGDLAEKIFKVSLTIRRLQLEDVYVGICLDKLGVAPVPPPKESDFNHWRVSYSDCTYNQIVTSHEFKPNELIRYWNQLQQNKHKCANV